MHILAVYLCFFRLISSTESFDIGKLKTSTDNHATVVGVIEDSTLIDNESIVRISVFSNYFYGFAKNNEQIVEAKVIGGGFTAAIPAPSKYFYITFAIWTSGKKIYPLSDALYLMEKEDSLEVKIEKDRYTFTGRGSEKMDCQAKLQPIKYKEPLAIINLANQKKFYPYYEGKMKLRDSIFQIKRKILNEFSSKVDKDIYKILYLDCLGDRDCGIFTDLKTSVIFEFAYLRWAGAKKLFDNHYFRNFDVQKEDEKLLIQSRSYVHSVFLREQARELLADVEIVKNRVSPNRVNFRPIFERITTKYRGLVKEKILAICFTVLAKAQEDRENFEKTLKVVKSEYYRELIIDIQQSRGVGAPAYAFSLQDSTGKIYKLQDFEGKVIVMDFWFTGCSGCITLAKNLKPVISTFKNVDRIVFISVNVDLDRKTWLDGLKQGIYSSFDCVNLFTNGKGIEDSLTKHYFYSSFPQLLIVDKHGRVISAKASITNDATGSNEFINKLKSYL